MSYSIVWLKEIKMPSSLFGIENSFSKTTIQNENVKGKEKLRCIHRKKRERETERDSNDKNPIKSYLSLPILIYLKLTIGEVIKIIRLLIIIITCCPNFYTDFLSDSIIMMLPLPLFYQISYGKCAISIL